VDGGRVIPAEREYRVVWQEFSTAYRSCLENERCIDCGEPASDVYHSTRAKFQPPQERAGIIYEKNCAAVCSACREVRERYRR